MPVPRFVSIQISFSIVLAVTASMSCAVRANTVQASASTERSVNNRSDNRLFRKQADCRPFLIEGTARSKGLVGKFLIAADPREQIATLQVTDAGPADFSFGVSGSQAWVEDANGVVSDADFDG